MTIRTKTNSLQEVSTLEITWSNDRHEIEKRFSTDRRRPDTGGTHNRRGGGSNTPLPYKVVALTHAHAHARESDGRGTMGTAVVNTPASIGPQLAHKWLHHGSWPGRTARSNCPLPSLSLTHSDERTRHGQSSLRSHRFRLRIKGKPELCFTAYLFWWMSFNVHSNKTPILANKRFRIGETL